MLLQSRFGIAPPITSFEVIILLYFSEERKCFVTEVKLSLYKRVTISQF